ncbi:exosortase family protein XrtF [Catalinimonas sp. 4WD22]|uniref:exosortase X n=1 Tax=Catalinimonas locisalis TaxID=3133978 RepID=UPI0031016F89
MKNNKSLYLFLAKCAGLYLIWNIAYFGWIASHTNIEMWITSKTAMVSTRLLNLVGYEASYIDVPHSSESKQSVSLILVDEVPLLYIADSCNAFTLMVLFMGFIIAYPGNWKHKMWFIAAGCLAVFLINVIRVQFLIYNYMYYHSWFEFNHKYTFTIAVYLCVFYFWMVWANSFGKERKILKFRSQS